MVVTLPVGRPNDMSMAASTVADHRQRVLRALGVVPYVRRARQKTVADTPAGAAGNVAMPPTVAGLLPCVLVLPEGCTERQQHLLARVMQALGKGFARAPSVVVAGRDLHEPVPHASAYLVFGEAQARALGRSLPTAVMTAAEVLLLDDPQALLQGDGKRRLWQAIGGLRRHWRKTAAG